MSLLEAALSGAAIVSTRHAGIPEFIVHGKAGLLSEEGNPRALAANLELALGSPALRSRLVLEGRKRLISEFDLTKNSLELERLYWEVVSKWTDDLRERVSGGPL